jgi:ATP-binding cassette subfamily B protein
MILLILATLGAELFILIFNTYLTRWFGQMSLHQLRVDVFQKIQSLHVQFFDKNPIGRLITRTTSDIEALSSLLSDGIVNLIGDMFRIIFILYFMITMSWELTVIAILVLPILFYATFWFNGKMKAAFLGVRDQVARLNSFIQEHIQGITIVQLFNREKDVERDFATINEDHRKAHNKTIFYFSIFWPTIEVLASVAMALVVWYGGGRALLGGVTFGVLLAFIQYVRQFFQPIRGISEKWNALQSALASSQRLFEVLDTENDIKAPTSSSPQVLNLLSTTSVKPAGHIEFRGVWFRYNKESDFILKDVSFEAKPGETLAVVGATGAGKSTLINCILRYYEIEKGEILVDGVNIREYALEDLRSRFSLVLQDNALFSGTIEENITLGDPKISMQDVKKTAVEIGAHDFIDTLPNGYQTKLAERGASLSLGQRQLICFIRAKVVDPPILILDEATSSIDSESEALVTRACEEMMRDRTSIVIAHRLSTIQQADHILVMHKGRVMEEGNHQSLLEQEDGIYRKLVQLQMANSTAA